MASKLPKQDLALTRLWTDNEIGGRLYLQMCNLFPEALLTERERGEFLDALFSSMHKITATKYHLENYRRIEAEQFREARRAFRRKQFRLKEAFELIFELEAFLFQVKSSLDMLVKMLDPILGRGTVRTQTFGSEGDSVIRGLEQYKKRKDAPSRAIDELIAVIREDKQSWIELVVEVRDELSHVRGIQGYAFVPEQLPDGEVTAKKPQFTYLGTVPFMELVYSNNLEFHQDFFCLAMGIRGAKNSLLLIGVEPDAMVQKFNHNGGRYVKYGWAIPPDGSVAEQGHSSGEVG